MYDITLFPRNSYTLHPSPIIIHPRARPHGIRAAEPLPLCMPAAPFFPDPVAAAPLGPVPVPEAGLAVPSPVDPAAKSVADKPPIVVVISPMTSTVLPAEVAMLMGVPLSVMGWPGASVCEPTMYCVVPSTTAVEMAGPLVGLVSRVAVISPMVRTWVAGATRVDVVPWAMAMVEPAGFMERVVASGAEPTVMGAPPETSV